MREVSVLRDLIATSRRCRGLRKIDWEILLQTGEIASSNVGEMQPRHFQLDWVHHCAKRTPKSKPGKRQPNEDFNQAAFRAVQEASADQQWQPSCVCSVRQRDKSERKGMRACVDSPSEVPAMLGWSVSKLLRKAKMAKMRDFCANVSIYQHPIHVYVRADGTVSCANDRL